jgi:aconitate hydratase
MGVIPLQFMDGESAESLGLTGHETYSVIGLGDAVKNGFSAAKRITVHATGANGVVKAFETLVRIDTPMEIEYYKHGGILQYVLRQLLKS